MHIHILGICGTFMGGLAQLAKQAGHTVTGCDANVYPPMSSQLEQAGIALTRGFGVEQLQHIQPDIFIIGNVVSRSHLEDGTPRFPLMEHILNAGLPYTSGPQWLSENILHGRHVLAVAGTHGKTTASSMLAWILEEAGHNPGFLIGGVPRNFGVSARLTDSRYFVIEADEYDTAFFDKRSKFVHYRPRTAVLNNLEFDHADIFDDLAAIQKQFHHLLRCVPGNGRVVSNAQQNSLHQVLQQGCWSEQVFFGIHKEGADASPRFQVADFDQGNGTSFTLVDVQELESAPVRWELSGQFNALNAAAAAAAAQHIGIGIAQSAAALCRFQNAKRRMEHRGSVNGIDVFDDFAHHPTAIRATLTGLRRQWGSDRRILVAFEPRSNTMQLGTMKAQLPEALTGATHVFCHSKGLNWDANQTLSPIADKTTVSDNIDTLVNRIAAHAQTGDAIVCMSNGSFDGIHDRLLQALQRLPAAAASPAA